MHTVHVEETAPRCSYKQTLGTGKGHADPESEPEGCWLPSGAIVP